MALREDLLAPISSESPSGVDLRYDTKLLVFDKINEARRQDDDLKQDVWVSERKVANWPLVLSLAEETLATTSKDLQLAAYLAEALLQTDRFGGLRQGLDFAYRLLTEFWDTVHPVIEDGDLELRARPLIWIGLKLDFPVRATPIVSEGYSYFRYEESRIVGYEDQTKTDKDRKTRKDMIERDGKLAPEIFDKAFAETPKAFYLKDEKDLDACLATIAKLESFCDDRFEGDAPSFNKLRTAVNDVRRVVHQLLEKKREKEPDPVEVAPVEETPAAEEASTVEDSSSRPAQPAAASLSAPLLNQNQAIDAVVAAAAFLRKAEPLSPAPYLMLRGLRWGELRGGLRLKNSTLLEAPPTELRQKVKKLALGKKWPELLEAGEQAFSHPGTRGWLDLQRLTVAACTALGKDYDSIATAIQSELRALMNDLPDLLNATLLDDTPAANPETREWLKGLESAVRSETADAEEPSTGLLESHNGAARWLSPAMDAYALAKDAVAAGQEEKAFAIMGAEVARQRSGRQRFRRMRETIELAIAAGKDTIAQPLLEDLAAAIETHKLDAWEDPESVAGDLAMIMRHSKKVQGNQSDKQKLFERICRLDPVQALKVG
jgi:type VI secretion system protein ImpA